MFSYGFCLVNYQMLMAAINYWPNVYYAAGWRDAMELCKRNDGADASTADRSELK